jgi:hypothetical protein
MRTRPRSTLPFALVMVGLAFMVPLGACNGESEGQPCDQGSQDCQSPLVCNSTTNGGFRCCPPAGQNATTEICGAPHEGVVNSNNPPVDSGVTESGTDAPVTVEAASAGGPDGSSDAPGSDGSDGAPAADGPTE